MLCYLVNVNITGRNLLYHRYEKIVRNMSEWYQGRPRSRLTYNVSNLTDNDVVFSAGAKLAPFGWGGERVHCPAVM